MARSPACRARCLAPALALAWALTLAPRAEAALSARGSARLSVDLDLDTNARRDFLQTGPAADLVQSAFAAFTGELTSGDVSARARYELGARLFTTLPTENTLVQLARLDGTWWAGRAFRLGLFGQWKDRRGGVDLSYRDVLGGAFLEFIPDAQVEVRLEGRGHRFVYWPAYAYSYAAPELSATARYHFDRHHSAFTYGELGQRGYNADAREPPGVKGPPGLRADTVLTAGAGYAYHGPFNLTLSYAFVQQDSNSYGESLERHRLTLVGALRLPWSLNLLGELALQLTRYPDGVYLSAQYSLKQDAENFNQVSLRLIRPCTRWLDVEVNYAFYYDQLPANGFTYLRQVAGVGLALRL